MRALIRVTGAVQGIGYRPFVAELASKYELRGEVKNLGGIVEIIADGDDKSISSFVDELKNSSPSGSIVINISLEYLKGNEPEGPQSYSGFRIVESSDDSDNTYLPVFPPDIGICDECMAEMQSANDRRYEHPLISCASCGPRFSILRELPYDRETTTMGVFLMCPDCAKEYKKGRRRHAQTISCHECGPKLSYWTTESDSDTDAVLKAVESIKKGKIVGLKGIGGYQLLADPTNFEAVKRLREIKGREQKPFAVMFDSLDDIKEICLVSSLEEEYLTSSSRPIVLLDKKISDVDFAQSDISDNICPERQNAKDFAPNVCGESRQIGAFLPASGFQKLLTAKLKQVIATSGNISGEPMIVSDEEFKKKFAGKIDGILYYNREILRPLDDSVVQIIKRYDGSEVPRFIRRARGYVPLPVFLGKPLKEKTLYQAMGADLKNTFSIGYGDKIIMSQFLGDMEDYGVLKLQKREFKEFNDIFRTDRLEAENKIIISDMHPGYHSSELANEYSRMQTDAVSRIKIQHHHAHIGSVMAEYGLTECIGVAFDGTGYGEDETIWGSEFLICKGGSFERAKHLKPVHIVGQDEGMKNAAIAAACYLIDSGISVPDDIMAESELKLLKAALDNNINSFPNSGMGRLFDAVSCILGICKYNSYEGECAIKLQNMAEEYAKSIVAEYKTDLFNQNPFRVSEDTNEIDAKTFLKKIIEHRDSLDKGLIAYSFHYHLAMTVRDICISLRNRSGLNDICLSGGVFANRLLLSMCEKLLVEADFVVYYNIALPTNDGGISAGQIYLADLLQESQVLSNEHEV